MTSRTVEPIAVSPHDFDAAKAQLTSRSHKEFGGVPFRFDGAQPVEEFTRRFGWGRQPTPLEYQDLIYALLWQLGRDEDAIDIILTRFDWLIAALEAGAEPLPDAVHLAAAYVEAGL
ncbi:hypothetical protein ACFQ9V_00970 [Leifsonia sp. NPDC056665]|uniref:hypothetical protein n=1 Tax=Leifsonia sp. NPDC056665 TaxID=3345901 RepID=UPI0036CE33DD